MSLVVPQMFRSGNNNRTSDILSTDKPPLLLSIRKYRVSCLLLILVFADYKSQMLELLLPPTCSIMSPDRSAVQGHTSNFRVILF